MFLVLVGFCLLFNVKTAQAASFSQWVYGNEVIVKLHIDGTGLVWAMGPRGKIATFDSIRWHRVHEHDTNLIHSNIFDYTFEPENNRIWGLGHHPTLLNTTRIIYWTPETGWIDAGHISVSPSNLGSRILIDNEGRVYAGLRNTSVLYRWNGGTSWSAVWSNLDSLHHVGYKHSLDWHYDRVNNRIWCLYDTTSHLVVHTAYFDLNTGQGHWAGIAWSGSTDCRGLTSDSEGNIYILRGSQIRRWTAPNTWTTVYGQLPDQHYSKLLLHNPQINTQIYAYGSAIDNYDRIGWPGVSGGNIGGRITWPFTGTAITDIVIGGYVGEMYAAGQGGRFAVYMNGTWHTDSNTFTDFVIAKVRELAADAKKASDIAAARAQDAVNQTWYTGAFGGNTDSVANIAGYIRNTQLPGLENKINNLESTINNLQAVSLPPSVKLQTVSGARATSGSQIQAIVNITSSVTGPYSVKVNGTSQGNIQPGGTITLSMSPTPGPQAFNVEVIDSEGNIGSDTIVIRKL